MKLQKTEHELAITSAIVEQVRFKANLNYSIKISETAQSAIREFLDQQEFNDNGANVVFTTSVPADYATTAIVDGDYRLMLAFGKNNRKDQFPNVLFCCLTKTPEAKFRGFWRHRHLPEALLSEAMNKIDLTSPVEIVVFDNASGWNMMRKSDSGDPKVNITFIGQAPHEKTGSFVPSLPIGYVKLNKIVLTCPNEKLVRGREFYTFK